MTGSIRNSGSEATSLDDPFALAQLEAEQRLQSEMLAHERFDWIWIASPALMLLGGWLLNFLIRQMTSSDSTLFNLAFEGGWSAPVGLLLIAAGGAATAITLRRNRSRRLMQLEFLALSREARQTGDAIAQERD